MAKFAIRWTESDGRESIGDAEDVLRELRMYALSPSHWEAIQKALADLEKSEVGAVADLIDYVVRKIA